MVVVEKPLRMSQSVSRINLVYTGYDKSVRTPLQICNFLLSFAFCFAMNQLFIGPDLRL